MQAPQQLLQLVPVLIGGALLGRRAMWGTVAWLALLVAVGGWRDASMFVNNNVQFGAAVGQSVNLTAGTTYTLNFYLAGLNGYGQATVNVDIGGFHQSFTNTHSTVSDWVLQTMQFTATSTGASNLVFRSAGGAVELDDVALAEHRPLDVVGEGREGLCEPGRLFGGDRHGVVAPSVGGTGVQRAERVAVAGSRRQPVDDQSTVTRMPSTRVAVAGTFQGSVPGSSRVPASS